MTWPEFYAELKTWQGLIGSLLGFAALIGGALFNAHLNRRRDDRLRIIEANTVALSLYGEINLLRHNMASMANGIGAWFLRGGYGADDLPDYYNEFFSLREPTLYNALASRIGMLNESILLPVTKFYSDYEAAVGHFPKLLKNEERKMSYGVEWVLAPAVSAVEDIESAIRQIEALGGISTRAATPQVVKAREALTLAEDLRLD